MKVIIKIESDDESFKRVKKHIKMFICFDYKIDNDNILVYINNEFAVENIYFNYLDFVKKVCSLKFCLLKYKEYNYKSKSNNKLIIGRIKEFLDYRISIKDQQLEYIIEE